MGLRVSGVYRCGCVAVCNAMCAGVCASVCVYVRAMCVGGRVGVNAAIHHVVGYIIISTSTQMLPSTKMAVISFCDVNISATMSLIYG